MVEPHESLGEYDVVRLLRPLPEYRLPVGAAGSVVTDCGMYSKADKPAAYEVEFTDAKGGEPGNGHCVGRRFGRWSVSARGSGVFEVKKNWTLTPPWVNNYAPIS